MKRVAVLPLLVASTLSVVSAQQPASTGATQSREDLQAIVDLAVKHDLYLISDEIYDRLTYEGEHTCVASLDGARDRTILLNGFSKAYAMTGWRVAYACAPRPIAEVLSQL